MPQVVTRDVGSKKAPITIRILFMKRLINWKLLGVIVEVGLDNRVVQDVELLGYGYKMDITLHG